jgi:hypothetical protein
MVGPFHAPGAAEPHASVCLGVRSHVPGTRRDRAPADEAGIRKAKPPIETPSVGIRSWAVFQRGSAHEPSPLAREWHGERLRRSQVVEILGVLRVRGLSFTPLNRPFGFMIYDLRFLICDLGRTPAAGCSHPRSSPFLYGPA